VLAPVHAAGVMKDLLVGKTPRPPVDIAPPQPVGRKFRSSESSLLRSRSHTLGPGSGGARRGFGEK
jgi:hypothetical protein